MLSVGADVVIDYTREDFAKNGQRYDRILDVAGRRPIFDDQRSLTETGSYVIVGGAPRRLAEVALLGAWLSRHRKQRLSVMGGKPNQGLDFLVEEFEAGKLLAAFDGKYKLDEVPAAIQRIGDGKALGKVVVTVST